MNSKGKESFVQSIDNSSTNNTDYSLQQEKKQTQLQSEDSNQKSNKNKSYKQIAPTFQMQQKIKLPIIQDINGSSPIFRIVSTEKRRNIKIKEERKKQRFI